jgi:hypothetical protein
MLHFEKLNDKEILFYQYGDFKLDEKIYTLKICAKNTENGRERLIGYWTTLYGRYQLSGTKKEMIFAAAERGRFLSLFLVNGADGIVIYLLDVDNSARTSKDLRYLMYNDAPGGETGEPFVLINLHKLKIVRTFYWKIFPLDGGGGEQNLSKS